MLFFRLSQRACIIITWYTYLRTFYGPLPGLWQKMRQGVMSLEFILLARKWPQKCPAYRGNAHPERR